MKKADNFEPSKWLVENKITFQSKLSENMKYDYQKLDNIWEKWGEEEISEEELITNIASFFNISKEDAEILRERLVDLGDEIGDDSMSFINDPEYQEELFDGINFI